MELHTFSLLKPYPLTHGSFFRLGGVSQGPYASLNFGLTSGDERDAVLENRKRALNFLGLDHLCILKQCHGDTIAIADPLQTPFADGQMTNKPGMTLQILHADCQAALFYDPTHHAIAAVHCGWRGNVLNIYKTTIEKMQKTYGSKPEDLIVCISPSLGPDASEFKNYKEELPTTFLPFQIKPFFFNLWEISKWQLLSSGIQEKNIELAGICTYANPDLCFSYRRLKKSGRHATWIALNHLNG